VAPKQPKNGVTVQRLSDPSADYIRLSGVIDQSFGAAEIGNLSRPTAMDLAEVSSITSQGVQAWCAFIKTVPAGTPLYLINVPPCFAAQVEFVPNFAGQAEIVTVSLTGKCANCDAEQLMLLDMLAYVGTGSQMLERCNKCGAAMVPIDADIGRLADHRARALQLEVAALLATLGVYRLRAPAQAPFEAQKLIEGNANLLRMSGTLDERLRSQRVVDGLEGTLLVETSELDVTPRGLRRLSEMLTHAARSCSPIVLSNLPYGVLEQAGEALTKLPQLILHSIVAPCYCAACDDIRQLSIGGDELLTDEPKAVCPRCGRHAAMVAGVLSLERIRSLIRRVPDGLVEIIGRFDELFSAAEVEAKLTSAPQPQQSNTVPQRIGPYRILKAIARGGMADVFLATRDDFERPVALKLLRREVLAQARLSLSMFLREARLNACLNHPNIVQVFDVNEAEGNLYIVMEFLDGEALWRVFRQHSAPFPVPIAIRIAQQVLRALQHAHSARDSDGKPLNIVHRDVSPSNVILCPDGNVKLIDFGIAIAGRKPDVFAGNPAWMSPEQFSGGALDGRSDLFSVATVLHEMLTGHQLFNGKTVQEIALGVIRTPIPAIPDLPPALVRVLERAHQRDPAKRFQTAAEFADALRAVCAGKQEASEHDVRAFVAQVMSGRKRTATDPGVKPASSPSAPIQVPIGGHHTLPQMSTPNAITPSSQALAAAAPVASPSSSPPAPAAAPTAPTLAAAKPSAASKPSGAPKVDAENETDPELPKESSSGRLLTFVLLVALALVGLALLSRTQ
jgi:serine/threonine protein kinase/Zn finger protein HypA/HybF involved in hydrogenase expression